MKPQINAEHLHTFLLENFRGDSFAAKPVTYIKQCRMGGGRDALAGKGATQGIDLHILRMHPPYLVDPGVNVIRLKVPQSARGEKRLQGDPFHLRKARDDAFELHTGSRPVVGTKYLLAAGVEFQDGAIQTGYRQANDTQ
jgi:hypothetical protein